MSQPTPYAFPAADWTAWVNLQPVSRLGEALDEILQGRVVETHPGQFAALTAAVRKQLGPRGQGHLALAQINTAPGDIAGNARKIMAYAAAAEACGVDLLAFPELALMGYPIRDAIVRFPALAEENLKWLKAIAERSGETVLAVGFVEPRHAAPGQKRTGKDFFNSMALLGKGKIQAIVRKSVLPTYNEFEDYRQFEPSPASGAHAPETLCSGDWGFAAPAESGKPFAVHGQEVGFSICEDMWSDAEFFDAPMYARDPVEELAVAKPHYFLNVSASPTRSRKEQLKHALITHITKRYGTPFVYMNQVGSVDETGFDGGSRVYDRQGQLIARGKLFEEQFLITNPIEGEGVIYPLPQGLEESLEAPKAFNAYDQTDLHRSYLSICQGIRDYFKKTGFTRAVIGLSGGLDSSVTAVLLADALGAENVLGISMPSKLTPQENRGDAQILADNLGMPFAEAPIGGIVDGIEEAVSGIQPGIETAWGATDVKSNARDNAQAITRATLLRQIGNQFNALPIATSDKSELYLGYATVNGDMSGALAPIGDLPKTKVRAMARWLNEHGQVKDAMPESIITKPSGADLKINPATGKLLTAEEDLMPYEFADEIIWRIEALRQDAATMLKEPFQYEVQAGISKEQKAEWLERFYTRMSRAVFKWFVSPPILIVEGNGSITKSDYHHPITANRIHWQGHSPHAIQKALDEAVALTGLLPGSPTI